MSSNIQFSLNFFIRTFKAEHSATNAFLLFEAKRRKRFLHPHVFYESSLYEKNARGLRTFPRGNTGCRARGHLTGGMSPPGGIAFQNPQKPKAAHHPQSLPLVREESSAVVF